MNRVFSTFLLLLPVLCCVTMFSFEGSFFGNSSVGSDLADIPGHSNIVWPEDLFCDVVGWQPP